ncbi:hypothetical protein RUM44_006308 [Polyplax serrata]|uniref:Uncharacterized protein n=1 Tax=Polyplax serrata TaxID=468196 RepID=A0ABR1AHT6_POLSC
MTLSIGLLLTAIAVRILLPPWPGPVDASESPERECCDPIYPLLTPTATTILNPTSLATTSPGFPANLLEVPEHFTKPYMQEQSYTE